MDQEKIGKFISERRKAKKLTQQELADKIGCTDKAISKWENGRGLPDYSYFDSLCKILDITIDELLQGSKTKDKDRDVLREYLAYREQINKKQKYIKRIIILLSFAVIILLGHFISSYKNINIYSLSGQSENFKLEGGMFVKSNISNILDLGVLSSDKIDMNDIESVTVSVLVDDEYLLVESTGGVWKNNKILSEEYGYNNLFDDVKLKNMESNLYLLIQYKDGKELKIDILKLEAKKILSNDKLINFKNIPIGFDNSHTPIDINQYYDSSAYYNFLIENGFDEDYNDEIIYDDFLINKENESETVGINYYNKSFIFIASHENFTVDADKINQIFFEDSKIINIAFNYQDTSKLFRYYLDDRTILGDEYTKQEKEIIDHIIFLFEKYNCK